MDTLISFCRNHDFTPKLYCQLFDAFVGSVLSYSSEVWGFRNCRSIENIHIKFCKYILNVRRTTSNAGIYGELDRYPLYITYYTKIIKYWFKLLKSDDIILAYCYG